LRAIDIHSTKMMLRIALISLFIAGAASFETAHQKSFRNSLALSAIDPKKEIGVLPPLGYFE
jgi:hypothetical protein